MSQATNITRNRNKSPFSLFSVNSTPSSIMMPRIMLVFSVFALVVIGVVMVYSASSAAALSNGTDAAAEGVKQLIVAVIGIAFCVGIVKFLPYRAWLGTWSFAFWFICMLLLGVTAIAGTAAHGAQRWIVVAGFTLQPSEFAKVALIIMSAKLIYEWRRGALVDKRLILSWVFLLVVPLLFLYKMQSDLGTTLIIVVGVFVVMWLGEVELRKMLIIAAVVIGLAIFASTIGYRADRFAFLDPWADYYGDGYQLIRSFYAFSEGGLFGTGIGGSHEKFLYIPFAETDFIFAILGEELGLIGTLFIVGLFLMILFAGLRIARTAPDNFGTMLAGGCTVMLVFQAFLNIGCVLGIVPTTGKPLPFISSGGSSMISSLIAIGVILSVSFDSDGADVYERRRRDLRVVRVDDSTAANRHAPHSSPQRKGPVRSSQRMTPPKRQGRRYR